MTTHTELAESCSTRAATPRCGRRTAPPTPPAGSTTSRNSGALDGGIREPARFPRTHLAGDGPRRRRRRRRGVADDAAFGQGARIRQCVPARLGRRPVSEPAHARRTGPRRPGGRAPSCPCRPDPGAPPRQTILCHQPADSRHVVDHDPVALSRRIAGAECRDHGIQRRLRLGRQQRLRPLALRQRRIVRLQLFNAGLAACAGQSRDATVAAAMADRRAAASTKAQSSIFKWAKRYFGRAERCARRLRPEQARAR